MERTPVSSTSLASVGYDPLTETLEIELATGSVYQYTHVPESIYHDLMNAPSLGQYFIEAIKDAYPHQRIP